MSDSPSADARAARLALERLLASDASELALNLPPGFADGAERYVALLLETNRHVNLTRVVEPEAVARLHLLDALVALPLIDEARPTAAIDLGSGGGVPGLVLALARPAIEWTLVDSVRKKVDSLVAFTAALGLRNVTSLAERAEVLGRGPQRERFELATARACAALPTLAEYALPLTRIGGQLLAWKGPMGDDELAAGGRAAARLGGGASEVLPSGLPLLGNHVLVRIRKVTPTPDGYPRRAGVPARQPLGASTRPT